LRNEIRDQIGNLKGVVVKPIDMIRSLSLS
jgi:hypothetical protein